jgi:hypothetical protein
VLGNDGRGSGINIFSSNNIFIGPATIFNCSFAGNFGFGAALYVYGSTYLALAAVVFTGNRAGKTGSGGAIYVDQVREWL